MKDRLLLTILALILTLASGRALADDGDDNASPGDPEGSISLAEHFATFAHQTFHQDKIPAKALELNAALYRAAIKLNPNEPRFSRALADIMLEMNDVPGAMDALKKYMALVPADQTAQVQFVDLCLASDGMQSLDQRLSYLRSLLQKQQIPDPVKSEIAYRAAQLLMDRGQNDEAMKLLDSARVLNPMNLKVLRIRYILTQATALPVDRVQQLLGILQANPADPVVASRLAEQLAQLGLVGPATSWYGLADQLYTATNVRADPAFVLGASSELLLAKDTEHSTLLSSRYVAVRPDDADGWFVLLSVLKLQLSQYQDQQTQDLATTTERKAAIAISNGILTLRKMAGDTTATTRPVDSPDETVLPDLSSDADLFKTDEHRNLLGSYESSLASLAWLELYYRQDTATAAPLIDDLARLTSPNDPNVLRLRAWQQYIAGDAKGALPKLRALGGRDPLAAMGAILIELSDSAKEPQAVVQAQKLLDDHPSGVIAAVLWTAFNKYHLSIDPSPGSATVATLATNVPETFMQLVKDPRTFYTVQVTPLSSTFKFGEPILVRVTLQNISTIDLAIGDDCAIHPELWFDAHMRGIMNQGVSGVAVGRLDQRLVLAPGDTVSTVVRVDQDGLQHLFSYNPKIDLTVDLILTMNPTVPQQTEQNRKPSAQPGACGFAQPSAELVIREPTPLESSDQRRAIYEGLNSNDGGEKIRTMDVLTAYIQLLGADKDPAVENVVTEMLEKLHRMDCGNKDSVLAFQQYVEALVAKGSDQTDAINAMANDDRWQTSLLALQLVHQLSDKGTAMADQLKGSKDPIVKDYATALLQSLQAVAASQPQNPAPDSQTSQTP